MFHIITHTLCHLENLGAASVQSLAGHPASLLSNAINMAASLSNSSATNSILTNSGKDMYFTNKILNATLVITV